MSQTAPVEEPRADRKGPAAKWRRLSNVVILPRWLGPILILGSLFLAIMGQLAFDNHQGQIWEGVVLYVGAIVLFLVAVASVGRTGELTGSAHSPAGGTHGILVEIKEAWQLLWARWRAALMLGGVAAGCLAVITIQGRPTSYLSAFLLWVASSVAVCLAASPSWSWRNWRDVERRILANRWEVRAVGLLLLVAFVLRAWSLGTIPPVLGGDEGSQGLAAIDVLAGRSVNPFITGWMSVPTLSFFWQAIWLKVFGADIVGLRLPWAVIGTASVLTTYLLVRRLIDRNFAFLVAGFLAAYDFHIHYSRLGSCQIADTLFVSSALYLLVRGIDRRRQFEFALCGAVVGLSFYFYAGARLTVVLIAIVLLFYLWKEPSLRREGKVNIAMLLLSAALVSGPMILFAIEHPNDFNARMNQVGIFQSGWINLAQVERHQGMIAILWDQFQRILLAFNYYPDRTVWYGNPNPLLLFPASALFALGLAYATFRWSDRRLFPLVAWYWSGMMLGGVLTGDPPASQRLITLAPPAIFLVVLALDRLSSLFRRVAGIRVPLTPVVALVVLALSFQSAKYYFADFTPLQRYGGDNSLAATQIGKFLHTLGPEYRAYFFGPPRIYVGFASIPYLAPEVEGVDVSNPISAPPNFVKDDKGAAFIFLPERASELEWVRRTYPTGRLSEFKHPVSNQELFLAYTVPAGHIRR